MIPQVDHAVYKAVIYQIVFSFKRHTAYVALMSAQGVFWLLFIMTSHMSG